MNLPFAESIPGGIRDILPFLAAALLHEAGHILACVLLHVPLRFFRLHSAGAVIGYDASRLSYPAEALIAAAGPLAGFLGAAAVLGKRGHSSFLFGTASLALSLFNLLPIPPMDGGMILSALLRMRFEEDRCARILFAVRRAGTVLMWLLAVTLQLRCGGNLSLLIISVFLLVRLTE